MNQGRRGRNGENLPNSAGDGGKSCRAPRLRFQHWLRVFRLTIPLLFIPARTGCQEGLPIQLGAADWTAPVQFTRLISIRELTDGILLTDFVEGFFYLEWESSAAISLGRQGGGPEEYSAVGPLFPFADDSTVFLDPRTGRWLLLDGPQIVGTISEQRALPKVFRTTVSGFDNSGHVLGEIRLLLPGRRRPLVSPDSVLLVLGDRPSEQIVDTLDRFAGEGAGAGPVVTIAGKDGLPPLLIAHNPLASRDMGLLFPDGWIAVARVDPYRVDWWRPDGGWFHGPDLPFTSIKVNEEEKCAALRRGMGSRRGCDPSWVTGWPEVVPPFLRRMPADFLPSPDGNVVVRRTSLIGDERARYDVIDRTGELVGVLWLPPGFSLIGFGKRSVYTVFTDALGLQTLRRHPWD